MGGNTNNNFVEQFSNTVGTQVEVDPSAVLDDAWDLFHAYVKIHRFAIEIEDSAILLMGIVAREF